MRLFLSGIIRKFNRQDRFLLFLALILLLVAGFAGFRGFMLFRFHRAYTRETAILEPGREAPSIYIEPDLPATRAAANYLAFVLERDLSQRPDIVTERDAGSRYLIIRCDAASSAEPDVPAYTLNLEDGNFVIQTPTLQTCFPAVKAVADRWLQEDCGRGQPDRLIISRKILEQDLSFLPIAMSGELRILSQNLRYSDDGEGKSVAQRAIRFFQLVEDYQPDLIGTQECTPPWKAQLLEGLGDRYEFFGSSRDGLTAEDGEWEAVLYRKDRFSLVDGGTFWLSNTPDVARSRLNYDGPDRICTWVLLEDRETGKVFLLSNTHLINYREEFFQRARAKQAEILFYYLRGKNYLRQFPGFLTGDLNGEPEEPFYSVVTSWYADSRTTAIQNNSSVEYTYQNYGKSHRLYDYCLHSPENITILDYQILDDQYGGYVSDHYGVLVTALIN